MSASGAVGGITVVAEGSDSTWPKRPAGGWSMVIWRGQDAPMIGSGYALVDVDEWHDTSAT